MAFFILWFMMNRAAATNQPKSKFLLMVTGEIGIAEMTSVETIYCKYFYHFGTDWQFLSGVEEGISSTCSKARNNNRIVLNCPIEASFSSTNPFGWPQIVLCCYGPDALGNDVIRGYGATHIPTIPGRTTRQVPIFVPEASTMLHKILGYFTGRRAEFVDPRIVAMSEGREVTRVSTQGFVTITFNVILKDLKKFGYDVIPQTISKASEFPMPDFEPPKQFITKPELTIQNEPPESLEPQDDAVSERVNPNHDSQNDQ